MAPEMTGASRLLLPALSSSTGASGEELSARVSGSGTS